MTYSTIECLVEDGVALLRLNRPQALNALNLLMFAELNAALRALAEDDAVRVLVLTGAGHGFCAGFDLNDKAFEQKGAPTSANPDESDLACIRRLWNFPRPTVIAVNGVAAGGGLGIALCGDIVLAARSASFVQSFVPKLGVVPDMGCTWIIPNLIGRARATAWAVLGDRIDANRAAQWGLVWDCVDDEELMKRAMEIAGRLSASPPLTLRHVRRLLREAAENLFEDQIVEERRVNESLALTEDFAEAIAAFRERRAPRFCGR